MNPKVGDEVKFFHPGMMGVVKQGTVKKIGSKYIWVEWLPDAVAKITSKDLVI